MRPLYPLEPTFIGQTRALDRKTAYRNLKTRQFFEGQFVPLERVPQITRTQIDPRTFSYQLRTLSLENCRNSSSHFVKNWLFLNDIRRKYQMSFCLRRAEFTEIPLEKLGNLHFKTKLHMYIIMCLQVQVRKSNCQVKGKCTSTN